MPFRDPPTHGPTTEIDLEAFFLDPRLEADSIAVCDLELCHVRLVDEVRFPWLLLIPKRAGVGELFDLDAADRARLMDEIALAGRVLKTVSNCTKINVAALGNIISQLHVHVTARFVGDPAWPVASWTFGQRQRYPEAPRARLAEVLRNRLAAD